MNNRIHTAPRILILLALATVSFCGCGALSEAMAKAEQAKDLQIVTPPLIEIDNGTYRGSYDAGLTKAAVEVTVKSGRIAALTLLRHEHGRGEAAEAVLDRVFARQTLGVEIISGATISSKVILKAAELALKKGYQPGLQH